MFKIFVSGVRWGKVNGETAHDYLGLGRSNYLTIWAIDSTTNTQNRISTIVTSQKFRRWLADLLGGYWFKSCLELAHS